MLRIALLFVVVLMLLAASVPAFSQGVPAPYPGSQADVRSCAPRQPVQQPVARSVGVTVPIPQPPKSCIPPGYAGPQYCPPGATAAAPTRPMPVRVDIAVRPEAFDQRYPVPVVYRDCGFFGPIIRNSVGLVGAVVAAPFRLAETLFPLEASACPQRKQCGPPPCMMNRGCSQPAAPQWAPKCPPPITQPMAPCPPVLTCAPIGPSMAPLPPCAPVPPCGPFMPPAVVARDEEPPCAPQSLLGGLAQLPFTLAERGRLFGDMGNPSGWAGPCGR